MSVPTMILFSGGQPVKQIVGAKPKAALLDDLDSRHSGIRGRLVTEDGSLHRFVNVYVNDEDVRFLGSYPRADGRENRAVEPESADGAFAEADGWLARMRGGQVEG